MPDGGWEAVGRDSHVIIEEAKAAGVHVCGYMVSWTAVGATATYELQEKAGTAAWSSAYTGTARFKAISGKANGSYQYQARGCNGSGCGPWSAAVTTTVSIPPPIPPPPTGLRAVQETISTTQIQFSASWNASPSATSYQLIGYTTYNGPNLSTSVIKKMLVPPDDPPTYQVRACNANGCSAYSAVVYAEGM